MTIRFEPWVGSEYEQGLDGLRVVLMGESHYDRDGVGTKASFTRDVVETFAIGPQRHAFFTKAANLIVGAHEHTDETRRAFWNRVAFYNYIQRIVGAEPSAQPTQEMWQEAPAAFQAMLAQLKPHCVVVLSQRLWKQLPAANPYPHAWGDFEVKNFGDEANPILAIHTTHPAARGFSYEPWASNIATLRAQLRDRLN